MMYCASALALASAVAVAAVGKPIDDAKPFASEGSISGWLSSTQLSGSESGTSKACRSSCLDTT